MPRTPLFISSITRGIFSCTAVASSLRHMPKLPSPVTSTVRCPVAIWAPMAAPMPKPMVPRPPLEMNRRFSLNSQVWAAHIWCWPTSVATGRPPSVYLFSASSTFLGVMPSRRSKDQRSSFLSWSMALCHLGCSFGVSRGSSF